MSNEMLGNNENSVETNANDEGQSFKKEMENHPSFFEFKEDSINEFSIKEEIKSYPMESTHSNEQSSPDEIDQDDVFQSFLSSQTTTSNFHSSGTSRKSSNKSKKPSLRYKCPRRVLHSWRDPDETSRLIAAVKQQPGLWDFNSSKYKLPKGDAWQRVANEVGNVSVDDAKMKWMNLRVSFQKIKRTGRLKGTKKWRHYDEIKFIECGELDSLPTEHCDSRESRDSQQYSAPPTPIYIKSTRTKHTPVKTKPTTEPASCSSPTPSSRSTGSISKKDVAAQAWFDDHVHNSRPRSDQHSVFGEFIASELRLLESGASDFLRDQILRLLLDFKASIRNSTSQGQHFPILRTEWTSNGHQ